jgi:hypothetical protein
MVPVSQNAMLCDTWGGAEWRIDGSLIQKVLGLRSAARIYVAAWADQACGRVWRGGGGKSAVALVMKLPATSVSRWLLLRA